MFKISHFKNILLILKKRFDYIENEIHIHKSSLSIE